MNTTPFYHRPLVAQYQSAINFSYWETVTKIYDEGRFRETIIAVLDYINPELARTTGNADGSQFVIPHGSIAVYLNINDTSYTVTAPFLKVPQNLLIPLLRQITEINFGTLVLAQVVMKADELHFQYSAPLDMCEPFKLYRVFEEICTNADDLDDLFIEKFGAERIEPMHVTPLAPEVLDTAYEQFMACLKEGLEDLDYYENKRIYGFAWDALYLGLMKIDYLMKPQGFLKTEIDRHVRLLNGDTPINERLNKVRGTFQKLLAMPKEKFAESMYVINMFISDRTKSELNWIKEYFADRHKNAKSEIDGSNFNGGALTLLVAIYNLLYFYHVPPEIYAILSETLESTGGKPWNEAAPGLLEGVGKVLNSSEGRGEEREAKSEGKEGTNGVNL